MSPPLLALVNTPIGHSVRIYGNEGFREEPGLSGELKLCSRELTGRSEGGERLFGTSFGP